MNEVSFGIGTGTRNGTAPHAVDDGQEILKSAVPSELGIVVMGGGTQRFVEAGQPLPFPDWEGVHEVTDRGGNRLVVPSAGLPELLVPVYTGAAGQVACTVKVPLPPHTLTATPVRIMLRISSERTLEWWFSVGEHDFVRADVVVDPWLMRAPDRHERTLLEHRREMRRLVEAGRPVSFELVLRDAFDVRLAGRPEEALRTAGDLLVEYGDRAEIANLQGLALADLGRADEALAAFRRGATLDPSHAVVGANYGMQLVEAGRLGEAVAALRRAISLDDELGFVHEGIADVLRRQGDEASARKELARADVLARSRVDAAPLDPETWGRFARVSRSLGEYGMAESADRTARELERNALYDGDSSALIASARGPRSWTQAGRSRSIVAALAADTDRQLGRAARG